MSPLWMKGNYKKIKNKPSLTENVLIKKRLSQNKVKQTSLKEMSGFASQRKKCFLKGSMTVEAALLLPLCMFLILNLAGVMELLRLHGKLTWALWNVGNQMTVIGAAVPGGEIELPDWSISYLLVNERVKKLLGTEYLETAPLRYGAVGLNYLRSEYVTDEECLDIIVTYEVENVFPLGLYSYRRMWNRYYSRCWSGYDVTRGEGARYVYVSPEGEVFHVDPECSYLFHRVNRIASDGIGQIQTQDGEQYEICKLCEKEPATEWVYYTEEGEKYHLISDCSAIFKNIQRILWYEGLPYRECSRCGAGK